jgi:hypothetical protein
LYHRTGQDNHFGLNHRFGELNHTGLTWAAAVFCVSH